MLEMQIGAVIFGMIYLIGCVWFLARDEVQTTDEVDDE